MKKGPSDAAAPLGIAFFCCVMAIVSQASPARAGSVFDDNWTPPARKTSVKTSATPAPRSSADTQPAHPARRSIPGKLDQARSRDNLKQVFGADMQDTSLAGRRKLAAKLFDAVPKTVDNPVDQYVLLGGAINAARESGNLQMCVQIAELLSQMFDVDGEAIKVDAALSMNLRGGSPADTANNAAAGLEVLDLLMAEEEFTLASKLSMQLRGLTSAVPSLAATIVKKRRELDGHRQDHDHFVQGLENLKTKPDDPAANLTVGRYYCFSRGDWAKGLPYLTRGSDAELKKAAGDELSGPMSPKENELVGNGWWAAGEKQAEPSRGAVFAHAALFYKVALNDAIGLAKMKMQRRLDQVAAEATAGSAPPEPGQSSAAQAAAASNDEILKQLTDFAQDDFFKTHPKARNNVAAVIDDMNGNKDQATVDADFKNAIDGLNIMESQNPNRHAGATALGAKLAPIRDNYDRSKALSPPSAGQARAAMDREGWVDLFDGKTLSGWEAAPEANGVTWKVLDGVLIGNGQQGYLCTRKNFADFHLFVEARIAAGGNSGVFFRVTNPVPPAGGWQDQISDSTDNDPMKTGSLKFFGPKRDKRAIEGFLRESPAPPGEWFNTEVIAKGPRIQIRVNGKQTVDYTETEGHPKDGRIALECFHCYRIEFRKVRIKVEAPIR